MLNEIQNKILAETIRDGLFTLMEAQILHLIEDSIFKNALINMEEYSAQLRASRQPALSGDQIALLQSLRKIYIGEAEAPRFVYGDRVFVDQVNSTKSPLNLHKYGLKPTAQEIQNVFKQCVNLAKSLKTANETTAAESAAAMAIVPIATLKVQYSEQFIIAENKKVEYSKALAEVSVEYQKLKMDQEQLLKALAGQEQLNKNIASATAALQHAHQQGAATVKEFKPAAFIARDQAVTMGTQSTHRSELLDDAGRKTQQMMRLRWHGTSKEEQVQQKLHQDTENFLTRVKATETQKLTLPDNFAKSWFHVESSGKTPDDQVVKPAPHAQRLAAATVYSQRTFALDSNKIALNTGVTLNQHIHGLIKQIATKKGVFVSDVPKQSFIFQNQTAFMIAEEHHKAVDQVKSAIAADYTLLMQAPHHARTLYLCFLLKKIPNPANPSAPLFTFFDKDKPNNLIYGEQYNYITLLDSASPGFTATPIEEQILKRMEESANPKAKVLAATIKSNTEEGNFAAFVVPISINKYTPEQEQILATAEAAERARQAEEQSRQATEQAHARAQADAKAKAQANAWENAYHIASAQAKAQARANVNARALEATNLALENAKANAPKQAMLEAKNAAREIARANLKTLEAARATAQTTAAATAQTTAAAPAQTTATAPAQTTATATAQTTAAATAPPLTQLLKASGTATITTSVKGWGTVKESASVTATAEGTATVVVPATATTPEIRVTEKATVMRTVTEEESLTKVMEETATATATQEVQSSGPLPARRTITITMVPDWNQEGIRSPLRPAKVYFLLGPEGSTPHNAPFVFALNIYAMDQYRGSSKKADEESIGKGARALLSFNGKPFPRYHHASEANECHYKDDLNTVSVTLRTFSEEKDPNALVYVRRRYGVPPAQGAGFMKMVQGKHYYLNITFAEGSPIAQMIGKYGWRPRILLDPKGPGSVRELDPNNPTKGLLEFANFVTNWAVDVELDADERELRLASQARYQDQTDKDNSKTASAPAPQTAGAPTRYYNYQFDPSMTAAVPAPARNHTQAMATRALEPQPQPQTRSMSGSLGSVAAFTKHAKGIPSSAATATAPATATATAAVVRDSLYAHNEGKSVAMEMNRTGWQPGNYVVKPGFGLFLQASLKTPQNPAKDYIKRSTELNEHAFAEQRALFEASADQLLQPIVTNDNEDPEQRAAYGASAQLALNSVKEVISKINTEQWINGVYVMFEPTVNRGLFETFATTLHGKAGGLNVLVNAAHHMLAVRLVVKKTGDQENQSNPLKLLIKVANDGSYTTQTTTNAAINDIVNNKHVSSKAPATSTASAAAPNATATAKASAAALATHGSFATPPESRGSLDTAAQARDHKI